MLADKTLDKEDINNPFYIHLQQNTAKLPMINYEMYHILMVISLHTSLGRTTVPNQAIQMILKEYKTVNYQEDAKRFHRETPLGE